MAKFESESARGFEAVTPGTPLMKTARALYTGTGGDIRITADDGSTATFFGVQGGAILTVTVVQVEIQDTNATNMIALR